MPSKSKQKNSRVREREKRLLRVCRYAFKGESLGIKGTNSAVIIKALQEGLPYSAVTKLEKDSGLSIESIATVIQIPSRTLARRKSLGRFEPFESERLFRLGTVFEKTLELFEGDPAAAHRWLNTPAKAFGGVTPLEMTQTEIGAREVEHLIGRLEDGVFS